MICMGYLNFIYFLSNSRTKIEIHTLQTDSNNVGIYLIFFSILCKNVGLSSCRTIEASDYQYARWSTFNGLYSHLWCRVRTRLDCPHNLHWLLFYFLNKRGNCWRYGLVPRSNPVLISFLALVSS